MNIAVLSKKNADPVNSVISDIISELMHFDVNINMIKLSSKSFSSDRITFFESIDDLIKNSDIVFAVGGDGTIIHYAKIAAKFNKPVLGINAGNLGFLAAIERNNLTYLSHIVSGEYSISNRMMIDVDYNGEHFCALNDVAINRSADSRILVYSVFENEKKVYDFKGDGIICSTPTGSTAYSLSAGGPIVSRDMECFLVTPVCPHDIFSRSIVLNSNNTLKLCVDSSENNRAFVSVDGESKLMDLENCSVISIKKSNYIAKIVEPINIGVYDNINKKMSNKSYIH